MHPDTWIVVFVTIAVVIIGFVWTGRGSGQDAAKPKPSAKPDTRAQSPGGKTQQANNPKGNLLQREPPRLSSAYEDDDLEITVITAFPAAELEAETLARAAAADAHRSADPIPLAEPTRERKHTGGSPAAEQIRAEQTALAQLVGADLEVEADGGERTTRVGVTYEDEADVEEITSPVARILMSAAGDSDQGQKRPRNEDSLLVLPERSLFAVADGMGGHVGGHIASTLAAETLRNAFEKGNFNARIESDGPVPRRGRELACAIQMANQAIFEAAKADPSLQSMGTTIVAARFSPNKQRLYVGHVGDSRCYRLRESTLRQMTTDHTMGALGVKGKRSHELFQAVGVRPTINIDLIVDKPQDNDLYLLCSDGLSKMVKDDEVRDLLLNESDLEAAVYGLIELANDRGGKDNITLILVKVLARLASAIARN